MIQTEWVSAETAGVPPDLIKQDDDLVSDTSSPTKSENGSSVNNGITTTSSNSMLNTLIPNPLLRPATPYVPISKDEREEFLQRENDLTDQIAEKENELKSSKSLVLTLQEELNYSKSRDAESLKENKELLTSLNEVKSHLEKTTFEQKEDRILMDSLKDKNQDLTKEVDNLKVIVCNIASIAEMYT